MIMLMSVSFVMAQDPIINSPVVAGESSTQDFDAEYTTLSATLGAIISQINQNFREVITFGGVEIFASESGGLVSDFEVAIFPTGEPVNFLDVSYNGIFQTSEIVDIRGVNSSWDTLFLSSKTGEGDFVVPMGIAGSPTSMTYADGDFISGYGANPMKCNGGDVTAPLVDCVDGVPPCPFLADLNEAYGVAGVTTFFKYQNVTNDCDKIVVTFTSTTPLGTWSIIDYNDDKVFDFDYTDGYSVTSQSTQALGILPTGNYDLYAIM